MSFDFKSLSSTPLSPKERIESNNVLKPSNGGFDFNALPKTPIELAAQHIYQYGSYTPESFGLGVKQEQQPTTQWGIGVTPQSGVSMKTAQTTPKIGEEVPPPKSYFEGLADTIDAITEQGQKASEQYKRGEINAATKYSGDVANITSIAVAPIGEFINQIPVVSGIMKVMSEGLQFGPKGAGEALSNVPGYKQILEKNPWISEYSEAITPTVENATVTAMNLGMLVGTIESTARIVKGGNEALQYRVRKDADGNLVTRNPDGDVIYIEDKTGQTKYGEKPANYPLIRINSAVQDIRESAPLAVENGKVTKNAGTIKEIITGTKSGQNWWAQNSEADAASQRVAAKVDLSTSIDTTGTVNTKPQQEYFRQTYLDKTESAGYKLLEKEDASVNLQRISDKLVEEFGNTNLPQSIVKKAIETILRKLSTTADELGNVKLLETAKEKSAAQRNANYERTQNNSNAEIKNKTVGRALRLVVEETSKTDIAKVNGELSKLYQELAILEKLDAMKVAGGKLGKYFSQISGNIVGGLAGGAVGGPIGAAAASVVGGELASALRGRIMSGKFKPTTPRGEIGATLERAIAETKTKKKVDLKTPDKKVGAPKTVKKTPEIVKLEAQIAKNVEAQKAAIKAKDYTLVAKLKEAYDILVTQLKKAIKYLNENGSVGMSIKKSVTPESVAKKADSGDMKVLADVIDDYDNAILDPNVNRTLSDMGLGRATREERMRFAKDVFDEKDGVASRSVVESKADTSGGFDLATQYKNTLEKQLKGTGLEGSTNAYDNAKFSRKTVEASTLKSQPDDASAVKNWEKRITSGERPEVLTRTQDGETVVADGAHKLQAYKNLGITEVPTIDALLPNGADTPIFSDALAKKWDAINKAKKEMNKAKASPNPLYTEARKYKSAEEFVKAGMYSPARDSVARNEIRKVIAEITETRKANTLKENPKNPPIDKSTVNIRAEDIREGKRPYVVVDGDMIIDGHHTYQAYMKEGIEDIPVVTKSQLTDIWKKANRKASGDGK